MRESKFLITLFGLLLLLSCDAAQRDEEQVAVMLEIDTNWVIKNELDNLADEIRLFIHAHQYPYLSLNQQEDILVLSYRPDSSRDLFSELQTSFTQVAMEEQADPKASDKRQIRIRLPEQARADVIEKSRNTNMDVMTKTFLQWGVYVTTSPVDRQRFSVAIPKSKYDPKQLPELIRFQQLEFYLVSKEAKPYGTYVVQDNNGQPLHLEREPVLTGKAIEDAIATMNDQFHEAVLNVSLHDEEAEVMLAVTQENIGRRMAVVLKTEQQVRVLSVATIQGEFGKRFLISGQDSLDEAKKLAAFMRAGELAAPVHVVEEPNKNAPVTYRKSAQE